MRSEGYSTDTRQSEYPLVEWGWGREQCERYVEQIVGETWRKSACTFCPFSGGKAEVLQRYRESPAEAADALFLEHVALSFNLAMTLFSSRSLRSVLEKDGNLDALRLLEERLDAVPGAVYRVRRIVWAKGRADRKVERLAEGDRSQIAGDLARRAGSSQAEGLRVYLRRRREGYPTLEDVLVAAPAVVADKCRPSFEANWQQLVGRTLWA